MSIETSQDRLDPDGRVVAELLSTLSLEQKLAQLVGLWRGAQRHDNAAPMQDRMVGDPESDDAIAARGLGQLTRHWGTTPVAVADGLRDLRQLQDRLTRATGIRALVHEECLTGVLAWGATAYPTPLAWGASFDPELVARVGRRIGEDLRALGVHQGLAPVLDVVRDARWGRVEEAIAEDPLVVGMIGSAYVTGLEDAGVVATLKHFAGYSASRGGRNHAPVSVGPRELADVFLPPFERAIRAGARSVMNSYADVDGLPAVASVELLTDVLRDRWGFTGTVVADYFAVTFLETMHRVAGSPGEAASLALRAGIDVELPTGSAYLELADRARREDAGIPELIDRALRRVLRQKLDLGLVGPAEPEGDERVDLDSTANRALARRLAEESIVLVHNDGTLPLDARTSPRLAVVGPNSDRFGAMFGCYSFVKHVLPRHPDVPAGIAAPTVAAALGAHWPEEVTVVEGCGVTDPDDSGIAAAVAAARGADVTVVVLGDDSGMFGRGTSGEGCDRDDLSLPGIQAGLLDAVIATGTRVVLVLVTGRPYALGSVADRCAAIVQAFFPGQEGGPAIAAVLCGAVNPSGRLPVQLPAPGTPQPAGYLHPILGGRTAVSSADPTPYRPFGFGMSYTTFEHGPMSTPVSAVAVDGAIELEVTARNTGPRAGAEVLQVYATDAVAQVVRPERFLVAFRRIELDAGEAQSWRVSIPVAALAFTGVAGRRIVEPGRVILRLARDAADPGRELEIDVAGDVIEIDRIADDPVWTRLS